MRRSPGGMRAYVWRDGSVTGLPGLGGPTSSAEDVNERGLIVGHADNEEGYPRAGQDTLSCFHFPASHRLRIRTTNGLERINQEIKRRSRVVRIFSNPESCLRLASALLKEWHEDWITGRRYLRMDVLEELPAGGDLEAADVSRVAAYAPRRSGHDPLPT